MGKPTLKQFLFDLVTGFESLYCENIAMKVVLTGCPDAYTRQTWQRDVQKLVSDPKSKTVSRAVFAPIYAGIDAIASEAEAIELLAKLPVTGKVN
ncbi:MAG: hypothetical protein ACLQOO_36375 [Terriglobia bacterium]